jgi:phosphatidate cytidylyltransferase
MNLFLRILSALILLPGFLGIFYLSGWPLMILLGIMLATCLYEYWGMLWRGVRGEGLAGTLYISLGVSSLYFLREKAGFAAVLLVLIATWSNDTFAYFAGKTFGKHKLAPKISPGKTWEGFFGGALGSICMPLILSNFLTPLTTTQILGVAVPCVLLAPAGDLIESWIKRRHGVKDSGTLLPGHGGVLDRIDALLLTGPWALIYFML